MLKNFKFFLIFHLSGFESNTPRTWHLYMYMEYVYVRKWNMYMYLEYVYVHGRCICTWNMYMYKLYIEHLFVHEICICTWNMYTCIVY